MLSSRFHTRLITLLIVATPIIFLLFTEEGRRISDVMILRIAGHTAINFNYAALDPRFNRDSINSALPDLELVCEPVTSHFGSRACHSTIAAVNGLPARYVIFYFEANRLRAMKLGYQRPYHASFLNQFAAMLGAPLAEDVATRPPVVRWRAGSGQLVAVSGPLPGDDEPAFYWLAPGVK